LGLTILHCRFGINIYQSSNFHKSSTNAFKENKIRNKGIDILARQENQTPVAIDIAKAKIFQLNLESILLLLRHWFWVLKRKRGGYYLIKTLKK
jgi:hypothetical protein